MRAPLDQGPDKGFHHYSLNGWAVVSDLPLPFLAPGPVPGPVPGPLADGAADIRIRVAPVPPPPGDAVPMARAIMLGPDGTGWVETGGKGWIMVPGGREIVVDVRPDLSAAELHTWLCGPALSVLSHHRRCAPLHACVVEIGGAAVALAGHSLAGKSTTAAVLLRRGHGLVTDDQAVIDPDSMTVAAGYPTIKLWGTSAAMLDIPIAAEHRVSAGLDKYHLPLPGQFRGRPMPLAAIVVLRPDTDCRAPRIEPVGWPESLPLLHHMVIWPGVAKRLDSGKAGLARMAMVARRVPVVVLHRPDDARQLGTIADMVEGVVDPKNGVAGG